MSLTADTGIVTMYQLFAVLLVLVLMFKVVPDMDLEILTVCPLLFLTIIFDQKLLFLIFSLNLIAIVAVLDIPFAPFLGLVELILGGIVSFIITNVDTG